MDSAKAEAAAGGGGGGGGGGARVKVTAIVRVRASVRVLVAAKNTEVVPAQQFSSASYYILFTLFTVQDSM